MGRGFDFGSSYHFVCGSHCSLLLLQAKKKIEKDGKEQDSFATHSPFQSPTICAGT